MQWPRRVPAGGHDEPQSRRGALDQPQQAFVNGESGDLVQVVQDEDDRDPGQRCGELPGRLLQVVGSDGVAQDLGGAVTDRG